MSLIYEKPNLQVVVDDATLTYELPAPSRTELQKLVALREESMDSVSQVDDSFSVEVFNRAFAGPVIDVIAIERATNGKCRVFLDGDPKVKLHDPLVIEGSDVVAYNTTHRVKAIEKVAGGFRITTNRDYTVRGTGGTAQLSIVNEEEELYRVLNPQASSNNYVAYNADDGVMFENQDPRRHDGSSHERKIYLRFSSTGTYRVTLGFRSNESFSL
jgi:hypothetical protein